MTETVQFRIQLPIGLRDMFKTLCLRSNTTMTDKLIKLIERDVAGLSNAAAPPPQKITSLNDDQLIGRVIDACDRLGDTATSLGQSLDRSLDNFGAKFLRSIPKPQTLDQIASARESAIKADQQRLDQVLDKAEKLNRDIIETITRGQRQWLAAVEAKHSLRQMVGVGAVGGILLSGILLWAISGTSPARSLSVALTGAETDWQAAKIIAGNGSLLRAELMSETVTLLRNPDFAKSYGSCISRAKASRHNFRCTITLTGLVEVK
jgi:hypothetical protein